MNRLTAGFTLAILVLGLHYFAGKIAATKDTKQEPLKVSTANFPELPADIKPTKSGDDRIVEIPKPLIPLLTELKIQYGINSDYVLPRNIRWDRGQQARDLRIFLQSINLPQIRFHDLRATWATLLLSKGVEPTKVMKMGGWKDMETMMIYMRKAGIDIKGSTDCLDDLCTHGIQEGQVLSFNEQS